MNERKKFLFEEWLMAAILIVQVALVCAGVLSRYVFNWSLSFTEELTRYLLIWLTALGFSAGFARRETIGFRWPGKRPQWIETAFRWVGITIGVAFVVILLVSSLQMIRMQWRYEQQTSVMGWPIVWVSAALPIASLLFLIRMIPRFRASKKNN